jgi:hypothetical protein
MSRFARRSVLALLLALGHLTFADYVLKWTLPVYLNPFNDALNSSNDDYAGALPEGQLDITGDGQADYRAIMVPGDDTSLILTDGTTDEVVWRIAYPPQCDVGAGALSTIPNLDGSGDTFLLVEFDAPRDSIARPGVFVYRCADQSVVFAIPQPASGYLVQAGPCPDMDGDDRPEFALYVCDGNEDHPSSGVCEIYGWSDSTSVPRSAAKLPLPQDFPLGKTSPNLHRFE